MSPTNARNGSMLTFTDASNIHSNPAATHRLGEFGIAISARLANNAPVRKYGLRKHHPPSCNYC